MVMPSGEIAILSVKDDIPYLVTKKKKKKKRSNRLLPTAEDVVYASSIACKWFRSQKAGQGEGIDESKAAAPVAMPGAEDGEEWVPPVDFGPPGGAGPPPAPEAAPREERGRRGRACWHRGRRSRGHLS